MGASACGATVSGSRCSTIVLLSLTCCDTGPQRTHQPQTVFALAHFPHVCSQHAAASFREHLSKRHWQAAFAAADASPPAARTRLQ